MSNAITLPVPTVHSNGTGQAGLVSQLKEARQALRVAVDAMRQAMPHGRDYYPQGDAALGPARDAHLAMIGQVKAIEDAYLELAVAIMDAGK